MALALKRRPRPPARITLVPMVDVMTIMLVFFMVTSTYLDLNMVPAAEKAPEGTDMPDTGPKPGPGDAGVLMIRIAPDGAPRSAASGSTPPPSRPSFRRGWRRRRGCRWWCCPRPRPTCRR